jgi:hypothetical protein
MVQIQVQERLVEQSRPRTLALMTALQWALLLMIPTELLLEQMARLKKYCAQKQQTKTVQLLWRQRTKQIQVKE